MKIAYLKFAIPLLALLVTAGNEAQAQARPDSFDGSSNYYLKENIWNPSVGFSYGVIDQNQSQLASGDSYGVRLLDTVYMKNPDWVSDVSLGIQRFDLNTGAQPTLVIASADARYLLPYRWSVGPIADIYLNGGGTLGSANPQSLFLGGVLYKEFYSNPMQPFKVGFRADSEVFATGKSSNFLGLNAEWTFGGGKRSIVNQ
jgi:hypothetical protein